VVDFSLFVLMCVLLIILPGPDFAIITKNTVLLGKAGGLQTAVGICCALLIHTFAAILGLSAIIAKSAVLFSIIKYIGAIYLIYLGIKTLWTLKTLKSKTNTLSIDVDGKQNSTNLSCFKQGFLTDLLNPKVAIFFLTFFPQFVHIEAEPFMPFLIMGITYAILTGVWFFLYVQLMTQITKFMKLIETQKIIEGITGAVLIVFGFKLALDHK